MPAISFSVSRIGDLSKDCTVDWTLTGTVLGSGPPPAVTPAGYPYPRSVKWEEITFSNALSRGWINTADQHHTSPYADGSICDVANDRNSPDATTMEIVRISGTFPTAPNFTRRKTWGAGLAHGNTGTPENAENLKSQAVVVLPNSRVVVYYYRIWEQTPTYGGRHSCCMLSIDDGVTFEATPVMGNHLFSLSDTPNDIFQPRGIIQASPGYGATGAPPAAELDRNYFYVAGNNAQQGGSNFDTSENGLIYLCRYQHAGLGAPTLNGANLRNRANYAFFTGLNVNGVPTWGNPGDLKSPNAKPIFRNIINSAGVDFGYFWQCHWHPALQQWIAAWIPWGNGNRVSIAHAPSLWNNSWQMLANDVQVAGLDPLEYTNQAHLAVSSPAAWSNATKLGIGLSTFIVASDGTRAGDDLILTQSSDLVALPGGNGDLEVGQATSGTLTWVANDQNAKPIVVNTVGNTLEQPNRSCIITLSNAVNGTISAATATTTLVDDDAPVITPTLPTGYPTPPNMSDWTTVTVTTEAQLEAQIALATSAGRVIRLSAMTNNFGSITINRPGARIAIIGLAPRFTGTITDRATLDDTDLTPQTFDDPVVENNCIVGGRAAFKAHTATNRMNLTVNNCDTLWVEGVDFWNTQLVVGGQLPPNFACDQLWLRKCSFDGAKGTLVLLTGNGGTGNAQACRVFVAWETHFFADGGKTNPDILPRIAKFTDYAIRAYDTEQMYLYKCIIKGGYNHGIALKAGVHGMRIDDCVFAAFDSLNSPFNMLEPGQEGSPTTSLDMTCGLTSVRGSTFTGIANSPRRLVLCWFKEATGMLFDNCMFYDRITTLILGGRMPLNAGTKAETNNVNSDFGTWRAGSDNVTFTHNTFRGATPGSLGTPATVNLTRLFSVGGGTYTFFASNNSASGTEAITTGTGVSKSIGANARFS